MATKSLVPRPTLQASMWHHNGSPFGESGKLGYPTKTLPRNWAGKQCASDHRSTNLKRHAPGVEKRGLKPKGSVRHPMCPAAASSASRGCSDPGIVPPTCQRRTCPGESGRRPRLCGGLLPSLERRRSTPKPGRLPPPPAASKPEARNLHKFN